MSTIAAPPLIGAGAGAGVLSTGQIDELLTRGLASWDLQGKRVVCLVPDGTRTAPMAHLYQAIRARLTDEVASLD